MLGIFDKHLRIIEHEFKVEIKTRGGFFVLTGEQDNLNTVERVIRELYFLAQSENLSHEKVHLVLRKFMLNTTTKKINNQKNGISINTPNKKIHTQNKNQNDYIFLLIWHFKKSILKSLEKYGFKNTKYIWPFPSIKISKKL